MGINSALTRFGLNENEANLYMAGLRVGPSTASLLAKESGIERVMTYHTLKQLQEKGLVSATGPAKKTIFTMESPSELMAILERRKQDIEDLQKEMEMVEAELVSMQKSADDHIRVRFYEGVEGAKNVSEQMLKTTGKKMRVLAPIKNIMDMLESSYVQRWLQAVDKNGITSKSVWSLENRDERYQREGRDLRLKPEGMEYETMMITYDDKTVFITSGPRPVSIVIENQEVTDTLNAMHEQVWKNSREV